jgi:hypothetical protein
MRQQKTGVNQIEFAVRHFLRDISAAELDIIQLLLNRLGTCYAEFGFVDVHSNHAPAWRDQARHIEGNITASTASLQASHPGSDSCALE